MVCGLMAFLGHLFPVYLRFRGGKGVAVGLGIALALDWRAALVAVGIWLAVLLVTRFVAIASILAAISLAVAHAFLESRPFAIDRLPVSVLFIVAAVLVAVRHRSNLERLLRGKEPKVLTR